MPFSIAQALRNQCHRWVSPYKLYRHGHDRQWIGPFRRQMVKFGKVFLRVPALRLLAGHGVADRKLERSKMAHQTQNTESAAKMTSQIQNQSFAIFEGRDSCVDLARDIKTEKTWQD